MSSLLQFNGKIANGKVGLEFYQTTPRYIDIGDMYTHELPELCGTPVEMVPCHICGKEHARLHIAYRKPRGLFGQWVVFEYNGKKQVPDLSCPQGVYQLPKDAKPLSDYDNSVQWHKG